MGGGRCSSAKVLQTTKTHLAPPPTSRLTFCSSEYRVVVCVLFFNVLFYVARGRVQDVVS